MEGGKRHSTATTAMLREAGERISPEEAERRGKRKPVKHKKQAWKSLL